MNELSPDFLSTIAQLCGAFIGFALLTPVFQVIASGQDLLGAGYIKPKSLILKWLCLVSFPIIVLCYPLLLSLFLIANSCKLVLNCKYIILNSVFCIFFLYYFIKVKIWSRIRGQVERGGSKIFIFVYIIVNLIPIAILSLCLAMLILWSFGLKYLHYRIDIFLILFMITGLLLIWRNLGIKFDEGVLFGYNEINAEKFNSVWKELKNSLERAEIKREENIEKMKKIPKKYKNVEVIKSIAESKAEIEIFNSTVYRSKQISQQAYVTFDGMTLEDLYEGISNRIKEKKALTLKDFYDFEGWRKDIAKRIEEFQRGTLRMIKTLDSILQEKNGS